MKFKYFFIVLILICGVTTYWAQEQKKEAGETQEPATAPAAEQAPVALQVCL